MRGLDRDHFLALAALSAIAVVSAAWWALALWPVPGAGPEWLARTRYVCFGTQPNGMPDAGGWILLIGQPISMLAFLLLVWGSTVRRALSRLATAAAGRAILAGAVVALLAGIGAAGVRVGNATGWGQPLFGATDGLTSLPLPPRMDLPAPALSLIDQDGGVVELPQFRGRPVLITFAFAHCETVCPLVVHNVITARARAAELDPAVVIVTVDPWRDTPARLQAVAEQWGLDSGDRVLSGEVDSVLGVLDAWNVPVQRDELSGDITHPAIVYVIDRSGRIAWAANGGVDQIVKLLSEL